MRHTSSAHREGVIEAEIGLALENSERTASAYRSALEERVVWHESKRLRSIVDDLLWLARLDSLPANPPHEAVDIAVLARSCAALRRAHRLSKAPGRSLCSRSHWSSSRSSPLPPSGSIAWCPVLLDNACRYANPSGRVECLGVVERRSSDAHCSDDSPGPGIAEDEREYIAQRFHRASAAPGGAGLGLSIADAVIRATNSLNGRVALPPHLAVPRIEASWPLLAG